MQKKTWGILAVILIIAAAVFLLNPGRTSENPETDSAGNTAAESEQNGNRGNELVIEIDPGHGGVQPGACAEYNGIEVMEKDLNLKIAQYMKEALEQYPGTTVYLTRDGDQDVDLEDRVAKAENDKADLLVSIHNNADGKIAGYDNGCTVLTAKGDYKPSYARTEQELACCILAELENLGIENQGILLRTSENNSRYDNGSLSDYYSIVKNSLLSDIPGIIIEHAFIDDPEDYENFLSTDEKLKQLGEADARAIAKYYRLGNERNELKNIEEKILLISDPEGKNNKHYTQNYF